MRFEYDLKEYIDPITGEKETFHWPFLTCHLQKRGFPVLPIKCLLDSGADFIIFPIELCGIFQVDLKKIPKAETEVVGGSTVTLYKVPYSTHQITIVIPGLKPVKETIAFCLGEKIPLLGRNFFQHFDILFRKGGKQFEVS